eukprot:TRINITY_DN17180_c0_g1_i1.p2 TRINITY_DN17180_c0_g1~~TRINITY_DN17180_c0_g1_i1.p2  ORF type:complete len:167 (-),score=37.65 TRINITY_DN17180_c0_g1_i1:272-772(-)
MGIQNLVDRFHEWNFGEMLGFDLTRCQETNLRVGVFAVVVTFILWLLGVVEYFAQGQEDFIFACATPLQRRLMMGEERWKAEKEAIAAAEAAGEEVEMDTQEAETVGDPVMIEQSTAASVSAEVPSAGDAELRRRGVASIAEDGSVGLAKIRCDGVVDKDAGKKSS